MRAEGGRESLEGACRSLLWMSKGEKGIGEKTREKRESVGEALRWHSVSSQFKKFLNL